jgi:hypothetical protein
MNKIRIDETKMFHNKQVNHFEEYFNEETRKIEFFIVFDDETKLKIEPYLDKDSKFESQRTDMRLNYYIKNNEETMKEKLNEKLKVTVELSKNLEEPRNKEEQTMLDDIMNEIKDLDNYIEEISKYEEIKHVNGEIYKKFSNGLIKNENNETFELSNDEKDYSFSIVDKNGIECKYKIYKQID